MFSGSWKESSMNIIELEIPDQNIDIEGITSIIITGFFFFDEI
jgi:hypothetical protein